jgi:carboxyl-terminal processing protease
MPIRLSSSATKIILSLVLTGGLFTACKKKDAAEPPPDTNPPVNNTPKSDEDSLKYLMYNIMQVSYVDGGRNTSYDRPTYYWYKQVPSQDPFSSSFAKAEDLLTKMIGYPVDAAKQSIDRYSFLDRTGTLSNKLMNGISGQVQATTGDYGLQASYTLDQNNNSHLIVIYTDKNGPAGQQGIQRGWEITAINGDANIGYDNGGSITQKVQAALFESSQVTLAFKSLSGTNMGTYSLNATAYNINPVLYDTVYTVNSKKVGYFVFYTFASPYNNSGAPTTTKHELDRVFNKFAAAGIRELIVDLRYNGGGSVNTAQYLDSAIAPSNTQGKVMYSYLYNDKLRTNLSSAGLPTAEYFPGGGNLQLNNVFFIVGGNTASASELTLNNLKPYMNVKMVGAKTYGKPVGFISFNISSHDAAGAPKYLADLYAINFETRNANNVGGYFSGIEVDQRAYDYVDVPWGNASDDNLKSIFTYISTGAFPAPTPGARMAATGNYKVAIPSVLESKRFKDMVDFQLGKHFKK